MNNRFNHGFPVVHEFVYPQCVFNVIYGPPPQLTFHPKNQPESRDTLSLERVKVASSLFSSKTIPQRCCRFQHYTCRVQIEGPLFELLGSIFPIPNRAPRGHSCVQLPLFAWDPLCFFPSPPAPVLLIGRFSITCWLDV